MRRFFWVILLCCSMVLINTAKATEPSRILTIFVDKSQSMVDKESNLMVIAPLIAKRLVRACNFKVAVEEIQYRDEPTRAIGYLGEPRIITPDFNEDEITEALHRRFEIKSANPVSSAGGFINVAPEISAMRPPGLEELTYSSILRSVEREANHLQNIEIFATLIITDASTSHLKNFEDLSPKPAMARLRSLLPENASVVAALLNHHQESVCWSTSVEQPKREGSDLLPPHHQDNLLRFLRGADFFMADSLCRGSFEQFISEFIDAIVFESKCMLIS